MRKQSRPRTAEQMAIPNGTLATPNVRADGNTTDRKVWMTNLESRFEQAQPNLNESRVQPDRKRGQFTHRFLCPSLRLGPARPHHRTDHLGE